MIFILFKNNEKKKNLPYVSNTKNKCLNNDGTLLTYVSLATDTADDECGDKRRRFK